MGGILTFFSDAPRYARVTIGSLLFVFSARGLFFAWFIFLCDLHSAKNVRHSFYGVLFLGMTAIPTIHAIIDDASPDLMHVIIVWRLFYILLVMLLEVLFFGQVAVRSLLCILPGNMLYLAKCFLHWRFPSKEYFSTASSGLLQASQILTLASVMAILCIFIGTTPCLWLCRSRAPKRGHATMRPISTTTSNASSSIIGVVEASVQGLSFPGTLEDCATSLEDSIMPESSHVDYVPDGVCSWATSVSFQKSDIIGERDMLKLDGNNQNQRTIHCEELPFSVNDSIPCLARPCFQTFEGMQSVGPQRSLELDGNSQIQGTISQEEPPFLSGDSLSPFERPSSLDGNNQIQGTLSHEEFPSLDSDSLPLLERPSLQNFDDMQSDGPEVSFELHADRQNQRSLHWEEFASVGNDNVSSLERLSLQNFDSMQSDGLEGSFEFDRNRQYQRTSSYEELPALGRISLPLLERPSLQNYDGMRSDGMEGSLEFDGNRQIRVRIAEDDLPSLGSGSMPTLERFPLQNLNGMQSDGLEGNLELDRGMWRQHQSSYQESGSGSIYQSSGPPQDIATTSHPYLSDPMMMERRMWLTLNPQWQ